MEKHKHTLLPCCKEATLLAEKQLQEPLPWLQRLGLNIHLLYCHLCRRYVRQSKQIDGEIQQLIRHETLDESLKTQWELKIKERLKNI